MDRLTLDYPDALLAPQEPPCLTLYQPTHRPHVEAEQDPIRFKNLVRELEESLREDYGSADVDRLLEPFRELIDDREFWRHNLDGLAVFGAEGRIRWYRLQRPVPELAVAADSFHTRPLVRIMQSADRFQVLGVNRERVTLLEGNRDHLDEVDLAEGVPRTLTDALGEEVTEPHLTVASYGSKSPNDAMYHGHGARKDEVDIDTERFFRVVDKAVLEHHSRPSGLPLVLAALPEHHGVYRSVTKNPFLVDEAIDVHPDSIDRDDLLGRVWQVLEPVYLARLEELKERFGTARAHGKGSGDLSDVARAAAEGRIDTLLVEAERVVPGRLDVATGAIQADDIERPDVDDLLDDIGEQTLRTGGEVIVVPQPRMPTESGVAAIYRY